MRVRNYLGCFNILPWSVRILKQHISHKWSIAVLMCHDISPNGMEKFYMQMNYLQQHYSFIDGYRFKRLMQGTEDATGLQLLLTFDDGFRSNRVVAETILKQLNIKGIFFIPPDFINCLDDDSVKRFISERLFPREMSMAEVPEHMKPMTWDDLAYLLQEGHCIGAHTLSHCRLSEATSENEMRTEIICSGDQLESKLGVPIEYFAYPFGSLDSISRVALSIAREKYKFVFSGVRGHNNIMTNFMAIRRDEISLTYELPYLKFLLEGGLAPYYYFDSRKLDELAKCN